MPRRKSFTARLRNRSDYGDCAREFRIGYTRRRRLAMASIHGRECGHLYAQAIDPLSRALLETASTARPSSFQSRHPSASYLPAQTIPPPSSPFLPPPPCAPPASTAYTPTKPLPHPAETPPP